MKTADLFIADGRRAPALTSAPPRWRRTLLAWVIMAVAMSLNGILREKVLVPAMGQAWAGAASAASGIALIQIIARQAMGGDPAPSFRQRLALAAVWLVLTVAFEFTFGHFVDRKSWSVLFANYDLSKGHLWPIVLASLIAAPFLWARRSHR